MKRLCAVAAAWLVVGSTIGLAQRPRVRLIATGGTISHLMTGRLTAQQLTAPLADLNQFVHAETEQFANVSSLDLTIERVLGLARRVNTLLNDDKGLAGIVVSMGTDTLEEVAYFLDLTVADDRPVVVVGSMRQPEAVGYEGGANLLGAFRVAADAGSRGLGVLVVLNDEINAARDVTKTHTLRVQTFQSREFGILGTVESGRVVYGRRPARPRERMPRFDISRAETLPRVDIVSAYLGATGDVIASAIASGARGLVMAGTGAGFMTPAQEAAIAKAVQGGVPVVLSSRTGSGRVLENPGNERLGVITAGDLNPYKARLLLMLAMMRTMDRGEIQRMFGES